MQKIIIALVVAFLLAMTGNVFAGMSADDYGTAASSGARETVEGDVQETLDNAREAYDEMGQVTYEKTIPKPEDIQEAASGCLDGILNADYGFGLSVPSVSSLLNSACRSINSGVTGHLNEVKLELADEYSRIGAGLGDNSAPSNSVDYEQVGEELADGLWEQVKEDRSW